MAIASLVVGVLAHVPAVSSARAGSLDWDTWNRLPVFVGGRLQPLDTFARSTAESITGETNPRLTVDDPSPTARLAGIERLFPENRPTRRFSSGELLFAMLADPALWRHVPMLPTANPDLGSQFGGLEGLIDQVAAIGSRAGHVSLSDVDQSEALWRYWQKQQMRSRQLGQKYEVPQAMRKLNELLDHREAALHVVYVPTPDAEIPWNVGSHFGAVRMAREKLSHPIRFIGSRDPKLAGLWEKLGAAIEELEFQLAPASHQATERKIVTVGQFEPAVAQARQAARELNKHLTAAADEVEQQTGKANTGLVEVAEQAEDLDRALQALHMAVYDNGFGLRVSPALCAAALEENRLQMDTSQPWLSLVAILYGSDALLADYPKERIEAVRAAFDDARTAYHDTEADDRADRFNAAIGQLATSIRELADATEPLRKELPIRMPSTELIEMTKYPAAGYTGRELFYNRLNAFWWNWIFALAAAGVLGLTFVRPIRSIALWTGLGLLSVSAAFVLIGFTLRGLITGYCPMTNMFETVQFIAFASALFGVAYTLWPLLGGAISELFGGGGGKAFGAAMEKVHGRALFALIGATAAFIVAFGAYCAPAAVIKPDIRLPAPVLRNNFWLIVHVSTIVASFGAGIIAWLLGLVNLSVYILGPYSARKTAPKSQSPTNRTERSPVPKSPAPIVADAVLLVRDRPPEACADIGKWIYHILSVGILLLTVGTLLGAMWGDVSWGRFWAWDPKEVWSLITMFIYLVMFHARKARWIDDYGMAVGTIIGMASYVMTAFGVNFYFTSGKHTYASGSSLGLSIGEMIFIVVMSLSVLLAIVAGIRRYVIPRLEATT